MGLIAAFAEEGLKKGVGLINGGFCVGLQSGGGGVNKLSLQIGLDAVKPTVKLYLPCGKSLVTVR